MRLPCCKSPCAIRLLPINLILFVSSFARVSLRELSFNAIKGMWKKHENWKLYNCFMQNLVLHICRRRREHLSCHFVCTSSKSVEVQLHIGVISIKVEGGSMSVSYIWLQITKECVVKFNLH